MKKRILKLFVLITVLFMSIAVLPVRASQDATIAIPEGMGTTAVDIGGTVQLSVIENNFQADDKVIWSTPDYSKEIVSVDETGLVTGLTRGMGTVHARLDNGSFVTFSVIVAPEIESIEFYKEKITMILPQASPVGIPYSVQPESAILRSGLIKAEVADPEIAEATGTQLKAKKAGTTTVTLTADNGVSASIPVEVLEGDYADYIESDWDSPLAMDHNIYVEPGEAYDLEAVLKSSSDPDKTVFADEKVKWTLLDEGAEYINVKEEGNILHITGKAHGRAAVMAEITNGAYAYYWIQVAPKVEELAFNEDMAYVIPYEQHKYINFRQYLTAEPADSADRQITLSVDNNVFGGVFKTGLTEAMIMNKGTATVTMTPTDDPSKAVSHVFEVVDPSEMNIPESIKAVTPLNLTRYVDYYYADNTATGDLGVEYAPEGSRTDTVWKSSDPETVSVYETVYSTDTVKKAKVSLKKAGTAYVTAYNKYNPALNQVFTVNAAEGNPPEAEWKTSLTITDTETGTETEDPSSFTIEPDHEYSLRISQTGQMIPSLGKVQEWLNALSIINISRIDPFMIGGTTVSQAVTATFTAAKAGTETLDLGDRTLTLTVEGEVDTRPVSMEAAVSQDINACTGFMYYRALRISYQPQTADTSTVWTSSDPEIVSAGSEGTDISFTAKKAGKVTVTARSTANPDLSVDFNITVTDSAPDPSSYTMSLSEYIDGADAEEAPELLVKKTGDEFFLSAGFLMTGFALQPEAFRNPGFVKTSLAELTDTEMVSSFGGPGGHFTLRYRLTFKAVKAGEETVQIGSTSFRLKVEEEKPAVPESITLSSPTDTPEAGYTLRMSAKVFPAEADQTVKWSSDNENVAVVDQEGKVTTKKTGTVTITAETVNGLKASYKLQVIFSDVPAAGKYYSAPVYWAVEKGITNGYKDEDGIARTFRPQNNCTREAVVTFLWRLAGKPEPKSMKSPFSDVKDTNKYYYKAVLWAVEKGITKGYADGTFKPNATCLREHVVTFLYRYAGQPNPGVSRNPFNDVKSSDYYYRAALWANAKGIAKGYSEGPNAGGFGPKLDCLREHVVTFLYRYAK